MEDQIVSLKKKVTKKLTVYNLKFILEGLPPKSIVQFYDNKMIIITKTTPPKYYTIYDNGHIK